MIESVIRFLPVIIVGVSGILAVGKLFSKVSDIERHVEQLWQTKVNADVCETQTTHILRDLDQLHATLVRIEQKIDRNNAKSD